MTTTDQYYVDENRVQACELNNPFYFAAENSYRVSNRTIVGFATNAIALSQGQFGEYPLFCFTQEGIWTMNIGQGDILISNIVPLSRHVCNNADSITPIDGGAVFSTSDGLIVISGPDPFEIGESAEGDHESNLTGALMYQTLTNDVNTLAISDYICSTGFRNYFSGAIIGYNHEDNEIILSNSVYNYSWVFSLKHKVWYKISTVYTVFIHDYPETYGYYMDVGNYMKADISQEEEGVCVPAYLETRPIKLSRNQYKKIHRMLMHGRVLQEESSVFSIYLWGSTDGYTWHLLNASRVFPPNKRLLIGRTTFSNMYFILMAGGKSFPGTHFTHVACDYQEKYEGKLR